MHFFLPAHHPLLFRWRCSDVIQNFRNAHPDAVRWLDQLLPPETGLQIFAILTVCTFVLHPQRVQLMRRFFLLHSMLSLLRGISIWQTVIVTPPPECYGRVVPFEDVPERALALTLGAAGIPPSLFGCVIVLCQSLNDITRRLSHGGCRTLFQCES